MHKTVRGALWAGAAVAVPAAINAALVARAGALGPSLPGDLGYYDWIYGRVTYYRLGQGTPLLLMHNPNAGGSSWEWRKVFPDLANHFTVYAMDLLGFGLSEKPDVPYSGGMFADLAHDFLQDVIGRPAHAIGSVLSASYLVNVAVRRPDSLLRLALVNPTGVTLTRAPQLETAAWVALRTPVLGASLYHALVSTAGIERELTEHTYFDPREVAAETVRYLYTAAHQPGSRHAASAFMAGRLDLPMRMAFADVTQPTLLIWGRHAYYTPIEEAADLLYRKPDTRLEIIDECGMLPQDEHAGEFLRLTREFFPEAVGGDMAA